MIKCRNCDGDVHEDAAVCPRCDFPTLGKNGEPVSVPRPGAGALKVVRLDDLVTPERKERDDERARMRRDIETRLREDIGNEIEWERAERAKAERKYEQFRQEHADRNDVIERLRAENELLRRYAKIIFCVVPALLFLTIALCVAGFSGSGKREKELAEVRPFKDMYYGANMNLRKVNSERDSLRAALLDLREMYDSLLADTARVRSPKPVATGIGKIAIPIDMVQVGGGTFKMGCTPEQGADCEDDEKPSRGVTLKSFSISKYPVTQGLWRQVMNSNPSTYRNDDRPVEQVTWRDANEFIKRLNQMTGKRYRLPTEAEWEYAARGGAKSRGLKFAGSNRPDEVAWYGRTNGTSPVGSRQPNELGIHDMSGNVREWVSDRYGPYREEDETNPTGPDSGNERVVRGGGWTHGAISCRVSDRAGYPSGSRSSYIGFRLASN